MTYQTHSLHRILLAGALLLALAAVAIGGVVTQRRSAGAQSPESTGESPVDYAGATFEAWTTGDAATLIQRTTSPVARLLLAQAPGDGDWTISSCEGAAGSVYCTWASDDSQLVLRVASEPASLGAPHAVIDAAFTPVAGGVAIWPFTTQEAASNTQASVDAGHSPWMADAGSVALFYAQAELGWDAPVLEPLESPTAFRVTDSATGVAVDIELVQPVRTGPGGIWAVTRLGSAAS